MPVAGIEIAMAATARHRFGAVTLILCVVSLSACGLHRDGTLRDFRGVILQATPEEIAANQRFLLEGDFADGLPRGAEGGVVFDGAVVDASTLEDGQTVTEFKIRAVLFGSLEHPDRVSVHSPKVGQTGVAFQVGRTYRVFTVPLDGAYRTWDWTGTVELPKPSVSRSGAR